MTAEERARYWLIKFEDQDCGDEMFSDEVAARAALAQHQHQWACHLFVQDKQLAEERALADRLAVDIERIRVYILSVTERGLTHWPQAIRQITIITSEALAAHAKARK